MLVTEAHVPKLIFGCNYLERFVPAVTRVGPEGIPLLRPDESLPAPDRLIRFDKCGPGDDVQRDAAVHFYVKDEKLRAVANRPLRYVSTLGRFASVITPDFSLYREMYRHERIQHTSLNRLIGVIFQHHGLRVIPNLRWSGPEDFDFCFAGVPRRSIIAISTHGCSRSRRDTESLRVGIQELLDALEPRKVIVHGGRSARVFRDNVENDRFDFHLPDIRRLTRPVERTRDQIDAGPEVGIPGMSFM